MRHSLHRKEVHGAGGRIVPQLWHVGNIRRGANLPNPEVPACGPSGKEKDGRVLVHEMTHLEQEEYGKPGKKGHHNREWVGLMERVGLIPSDTGAPGGKQTGRA